jgi:hypothetical protein
MKRSFKILLLVLFLHNISYSQDKSNVECGFFGNKTVEERNSIFPFSEAEKVLLISYPSTNIRKLSKIDSVSLSQFYNIEKEFIFHDSLKSKVFYATKVAQLKVYAINELSNLMFNYDYRLINEDEPKNISYILCYIPRNAILFLDKNEKVISVIEICFECYKYYLFPKSEEFKDVLGLECDESINYFKNLFEEYRFEVSQEGIHGITFEIKDGLDAVGGTSIIVNGSDIVNTDFDGLAFALINDKTEKVILSYMGKPTFIKMIKNCDFIKVDVSKGKAFYYKDNKFIKSKKLIF